MPTFRIASRSNVRAASTHRSEVLDQLREDHQRVQTAYRAFEELDPIEDAEARALIVDRVLQELTVHAALEEELLYPAARGAIADEGLLDQAEVEHASVKALVEQLRGMRPADDFYTARFIVLCEEVLHHVKVEEGELFPLLVQAQVDWTSLAMDMACYREELTPAEASDEDGADQGADPGTAERGAHTAPGNAAEDAQARRSRR